MRLLLDTHVMLWALQDSPLLGVGARLQMKQADAMYVSAVSILEVRTKLDAGKLTLPDDFVAAVGASGFSELAVGWEAADKIGEIELEHPQSLAKG